MKNNHSCIIIGGGVSGIICAIKLAQNNINVTILEKNFQLGKKIPATGNGKCNFFNNTIKATDYNNSDFVSMLLSKCSVNDTINYLHSLGIEYMVSDMGRMYPYSEKASSILDTLLINVRKYKVNVVYDTKVLDIQLDKNKYNVITNGGKYIADNVVIACGGYASSIFGNDGDGYKIFNNLSLETTFTHPGLVGFMVDEKLKDIDGLRVKANISLFDKNNILLHHEFGEVQVKKDGFSGIPVMNASNKYVIGSKLVFDFVPQYTKQDLINMLKEDILSYPDCELQTVLSTLIPSNLVKFILNRLNILNCIYLRKLNDDEINNIIDNIKELSFYINDTYSYDTAHITCGGLSIKEINEYCMIKKYPNLYAIGEILDIDGPCGGYNMGFATISALVCAEGIINATNK